MFRVNCLPSFWGSFSDRNLIRNWGKAVVPHTAFSAACLPKLNELLVSMGDLRQYLMEHPAFICQLFLPVDAKKRWEFWVSSRVLARLTLGMSIITSAARMILMRLQLCRIR
jgi:hypothetical protein